MTSATLGCMGDTQPDLGRAAWNVGQTKPRVEWIDCVRGLSIILVIIFHTYGITSDDSRAPLPGVAEFSGTFTQFRMPAMLFLSGLFVPRSIFKGARAYMTGKLRTIAYPYFLWSGIMLVFLALTARFMGRPFEFQLIGEVFYHPIEHLWFVAYLFIYFMIAYAVNRLNPLLPAAAFLVLSMIPVPGRWLEFWYLACFFMLGVAAVRYANLWGAITKRLLVVVPFTLVPLGVFVGQAQGGGTLRLDPALFVLAAAAIAGVSGLMMRVGHLSSLRPIRYVGERSIVFYLVHWPIAICVSQVGFSVLHLSAVGLFAVTTAATILLSWLIAATYQYRWIKALFTFPRASKGA